MARPRKNGLTENELLIMQLLWERSPMTIAEILGALPRAPKPAYNSVLTVVSILEKKGHLSHKKEGKAHLYYPVLDIRKYKQFEVKKLLKALFGGSALELAVSLVKTQKLSSDERNELKRLLEEL